MHRHPALRDTAIGELFAVHFAFRRETNRRGVGGFFRPVKTVRCSLLLLGATPGPTIKISADKLTVNAQDIPLNEVLSMLSKQARLTTILMVDDTRLRTTRVTASFSNLPLDQGINHLMRDWNYALIREATTGEITLFILGPRGSSQSVPTLAGEPEPPAVAVNETATEKVKQDDVADTELLHSPPYMEATLRSDLQSADHTVRRTALQKIESTEVGDSTIEDVRRLVQHDPDPEVRAAALDRLILYDPSEEALQVLRNLSAGSDESLRELAVEHLARIAETSAATTNFPQEFKY